VKTGYFTEVTIPSSVAVSGEIKATVGFYAVNPGALYWATYLIADSPGLGAPVLLDKAREIGQEGRRTKTYSLGRMPDKEIAISLFLFAHDDAGKDWDWGAYRGWLEGYPSGGFVHLASEYRFISPAAIPPPVERHQILEVDITPSEGGYVTTNPASAEGETVWYYGDTGHFIEGTTVQVMAYPTPGYEFEKWSDEIEGGVSYTNPAWVKPMTEHRAVKCHFRLMGTPSPVPEPVPPVPIPPVPTPPPIIPEEGLGLGLLLIGGLLLLAMTRK